MAHPITIPRLGWNMDEGVFQGWLKKDGDTIRAGDMIFVLESEKATEEIECMDAGIVRIAPNGPKTGDRVVVGQLIGKVTRQGEEVTWEASDMGARPPSELRTSPAGGQVAVGVSTSKPIGDKSISPRARRVARELSVEWTNLQGTGRTGRIRERDIRAAVTEKGISPTRRTIAQRLRHSLANTVPVTLTTTADATRMMDWRQKHPDVSITDLFVMMAAGALQKHPEMMSRYEGERVVIPDGIHVGIAVDTPAGLLVPVIRDVPKLKIEEVAARARELIERARDGKLTAADMQGGVFTVSNLGSFGIDAFTPIINFPECAILGVGRIKREAMNQVTLSLTFDHARVDGAPAARFLQTLVSDLSVRARGEASMT